MADAKKCDRCGEFFDKTGMTEMAELNMRNGYSISRRYDLCDRCAEDLMKFMRNKNVYTTYNKPVCDELGFDHD